ncbi:hypothetical protein [Bacillus sp. FJAT-29790]|nr:hypothetical protein [Bacillus sp. FJAT-29790]
MKKNRLAMASLALGAAYFLRNKESRQKLKDQFRSFAEGASRR